ncbi:MAG: GIY-YIG nuclease family protein [Solirubrobacteraceae bacterium]
MPFAYVYGLGDTGIYKVGSETTPGTRKAAYDTISTEPVVEYARIETNSQFKVETYIKDRLGSYRYRGAKGTELFKVDRDKLDEVILEAREFNDHVLPKLASAARLAKQTCDGTVVMPGDAEWDMYWRALSLKQVEGTAKYERLGIEADMKIFMHRAAELDGIARWRSVITPTFQTALFKKAHPDIHEKFTEPLTSRRFKLR